MFELFELVGSLSAQSGLGPETNVDNLSILVGGIAALVTPGVRYRYSTEYALFYIFTIVILGFSPFATRVFGLEQLYFIGGFAVGQTLTVLVDYSYWVITGESTGVAAFRDVASTWISRLRDRRRRVRRRIEEILDRKTIIAVLVGMPLSEFVKVTALQFLAAEPIQWHLAWANLALILVGLMVGVHWKHVKEAAESAGESAEEIVDGEESS
jgi:hypothetical protein